MTRRPIWRLTSTAVSMVFALMLLGAGGVAAATPPWTISATPLPDTVSPGSPAAYSVTISNTGRLWIPAVFLTDSRSETPLSVTPSKGVCRKTGPLGCALGPLTKGSSVTVVVVYQTPPSGTSFGVTFTATRVNPFPWLWWWTHRSAFDHIDASASTTLNSDPGFVGAYVVDASQPINTSPITGTNNQQTTLLPPTTGIGVTISQGNNGNDCGTNNVIGQQVALNVGGGRNFFPTPFLTTLKIATSSINNDELQLTQVKLCHLYDNASSGTLLPMCPSIDGPGAGEGGPGPACFWARWGDSRVSDEDPSGEIDADDWQFLYIDVWDYQNGSIRGGF